MPRFRYQAVNSEGMAFNGALRAESERAAARALERRGMTVIALHSEQTLAADTGRRRRLKPTDVILA
ncbi:MAG: hypothetical protein CVV12_04880, partial [Gammaproteobacteria bacterium HGW-Gammaproteobacteria-2]